MASALRRQPGSAALAPLDASSGVKSFTGKVLAQLQGADVGGDRPAVARRNLLPVIRHRAVALGHHVEEMADGAWRRRSMWYEGGGV